MGARLLILEAGNAAANNLMRSLAAGDPSLSLVGCNASRFFLKKSLAATNYLLPLSADSVDRTLLRIVEKEHIDLVVPTSDSDVVRLSDLRARLGRRVFLPRASVIARCQDKYALTAFLRKRRIPAPLTYPVKTARAVESVFARFPRSRRLWCRIRRGAGSYGAIPVSAPDQAKSWIAYWEQMRAVPPGSFTLSEFLPGRDYCVQCLWDRGTLVLAKMAERITYLNTGSPSGVSSMPAVAKTAFVPKALRTSERAIRALDRKASGIFFVDLKENARGEPCITEINTGRFATMTNIHDLAGQHNMTTAYVRLALGKDPQIPEPFDYADGYYLVRSIDTLPELVRQHELFERIHDNGVIL
jgi:carbamoyl-phosphate synthase large subunit